VPCDHVTHARHALDLPNRFRGRAEGGDANGSWESATVRAVGMAAQEGEGEVGSAPAGGAAPAGDTAGAEAEALSPEMEKMIREKEEAEAERRKAEREAERQRRRGDAEGGRWPASRTRHTDVLVIGAGAAGCAAARALAKAAPELAGIVVEAGDGIAPSGGGSYGDVRIFRSLHADEALRQMQEAALRLWADVEAESGDKLLERVGMLFYGAPDAGETAEGSVQGSLAALEAAQAPHTAFDGKDALAGRFPGLSSGEGDIGVFEDGAGTIQAADACRAMFRIAQDSGSWELQARSRVGELWQGERDPRYYALDNHGRLYVASKVVICAGPWTNALTDQLGSSLELSIWRVHWGMYRLKAGVMPPPPWFRLAKGDGLYYGHPSGREGLFTVGVDYADDACREAGITDMPWDSARTSVEPLAKMDAYVAEHWGGAFEPGRVTSEASPYTVTVDNRFVIDTLPGHPNVALFTGCNGRAFRFAPLIGGALAALLTGGEAPVDLAPLQCTRKGVLVQPEVPKDADGNPIKSPEQLAVEEAVTALRPLDLNSPVDRRISSFRRTVSRLQINDPSLSSCDLKHTSVTLKEAVVLANALRHNEHLRFLNLAWCGIDAEAMREICGALKTNSSITTIDLTNNPIGDAGVRDLATALFFNKTVETLVLTHCGVGEVGAMELAEALRVNDKLKALNLTWNTPGHEAAANVRKAWATTPSRAETASALLMD